MGPLMSVPMRFYSMANVFLVHLLFSFSCLELYTSRYVYVTTWFSCHTYTKQLRSARSSMKSNSWLMSYVIDGLLGFILFRCSSYILHTPELEAGKHKPSSKIDEIQTE